MSGPRAPNEPSGTNPPARSGLRVNVSVFRQIREHGPTEGVVSSLINQFGRFSPSPAVQTITIRRTEPDRSKLFTDHFSARAFNGVEIISSAISVRPVGKSQSGCSKLTALSANVCTWLHLSESIGLLFSSSDSEFQLCLLIASVLRTWNSWYTLYIHTADSFLDLNATP